MHLNQLSSGDLIADRRAEYAHMLAESGDHVGAADLMTQALDLVPDWAAGWFRVADYQEKSGAREAAVAALRKVLSLNPEDIFGAGLKLALLGAEAVPQQPSSLYVGQLFDDYAGRFDTALVEKLAYTVPEKLAALIDDNAQGRRFVRAVDLGCGTGLFGERIRDRCDCLDGFDLSSNMLMKAQEKAIYDHLTQADLSRAPEQSGVFSNDPRPADLVAAADVLMYLGNLESVFVIIEQLLGKHGLAAFSVEDGDDGDTFSLRPSLRYAHAQSYVLDLCARFGLDMVETRKTIIRNDGGKPVSGILFLARKTA